MCKLIKAKGGLKGSVWWRNFSLNKATPLGAIFLEGNFATVSA